MSAEEEVMAIVDRHVAMGERVEYAREGAFGGRAVTISRRGDLCDLRDELRRYFQGATWTGDAYAAVRDLKNMEGTVTALRARLAEQEKPALCGVCCGQPLKSGRKCICGGKGTEQAEMHGLRVECFALREKLEQAEYRIARVRAEAVRWLESNQDSARSMREVAEEMDDQITASFYGGQSNAYSGALALLAALLPNDPEAKDV